MHRLKRNEIKVDSHIIRQKIKRKNATNLKCTPILGKHQNLMRFFFLCFVWLGETIDTPPLFLGESHRIKAGAYSTLSRNRSRKLVTAAEFNFYEFIASDS